MREMIAPRGGGGGLGGAYWGMAKRRTLRYKTKSRGERGQPWRTSVVWKRDVYVWPSTNRAS